MVKSLKKNRTSGKLAFAAQTVPEVFLFFILVSFIIVSAHAETAELQFFTSGRANTCYRLQKYIL